MGGSIWEDDEKLSEDGEGRRRLDGGACTGDCEGIRAEVDVYAVG